MKVIHWIRKNPVLTVASFCAAISAFFVPPDRAYLGYFDFKTLACLFLTLAVVNALRNIRFFFITARRIILLTGNLRVLSLALLVITFLGSMIIANDMALITFLPLGYFALSVTGHEKYSAYVFILQNVAANLGGMLTPFGNPQNLYLFSFFNIPTGRFLSIMWKPFAVAILLLVLATLFIKPYRLDLSAEPIPKLDRRRAALYLVLFLCAVLLVFRVIPVLPGLILITAVLLIVDREALAAVDYPLLATFAMFFIFAGNMARLDVVKDLAAAFLHKSTLFTSAILCQFISNVPTAILLSKFTADYPALLLGVNIGGTGTLIASLASLITFSEFKILYPDQTGKYLRLFFLINAVFLGVLLTLSHFFFLS